ncbi:MAG: glycine zipper protein [Phenylobacterium sp.]|nr:glycine zipper protein [Phenylobacterium sp.]
MKIAALSATALALVTAGAVATPSFAQDYPGYGYGRADACQSKQHNNGTTGAVLGGIAGALIGSNLASHHGGRTGGMALGAVAGAVLGNNLGRSSAKSSGACDERDYGRVAYRRTQPYDGGGYYGSDYRGGDDRAYRYSGYDPYSY